MNRSLSSLPRIAWCSSTPFPAVYRHLARKVVHSCPWKSSLLDTARANIPAQWLVICLAEPALACDFVDDDVRYVVIGRSSRLHYWTYDWRGYQTVAALLKEWQPDLVHIHGTENYFGLMSARNEINVPTLIAIQGLLGPYCAHSWGAFSFGQILRMEKLPALLRGSGLLGLARQWHLGAQLEREILQNNRWFAGRTEWDRAHVVAANPAAKYRVLGELLRPEFSAAQWRRESSHRYELFFTNLSGPHKGGDLLLDAISLLRRKYPEIRLNVGGSMDPSSGYGRHLANRIRTENLTAHVKFLGFLDASAIVAHLQRCRAFVSPTYIDNSPNSLGEAMTVGTPAVCSYVGGIPSLGAPNRDLMFFPSGDAQVLATVLEKVITEDELARSLSENSRARAAEFHSPRTIQFQLQSIYDEMMSGRTVPAPLEGRPAVIQP